MAALFEHLASRRWEGDSDYTVIQSVAEDWENDPEAANKWVTMMAEASGKRRLQPDPSEL